MPLTLFEGALGGIGLFLLGMRIMSDGIRTVADDRIRSLLFAVTANRLHAILFGASVALLLNSPTAATIITIALVNGGLLSVFQALNTLGGVLVGASLSLYLPFVPYGVVATPLVFVGVLLRFFARRRRLSNLGNLLLGVGLLFLGLSLLEGNFSPSENHPFYGAFHGAFFHNSHAALLFGSLISCLIQSTVSLTSIVATLAASRHLTTDIAATMMLGGMLGGGFIACLASVAGISVSRRIAALFLLLNLVVVVPLVPLTPRLLGFLHDSASFLAPRHVGQGDGFAVEVVLLHTLASLLAAGATCALSGALSRLVGLMDEGGMASQPCAGYLDPRILDTPTLAMEQARKEVMRMVSVTVNMFADIREILSDYDARRAETIRRHEQVLDTLNHQITDYLARLARSSGNGEVVRQIPGMLQTVTDLEHVGDCCERILDCIIARKEERIVFSEQAMADLKRTAAAVGNEIGALEGRFGHAPGHGQELHLRKSGTRHIFDQVKQSHFDRICAGVCPPRTAMMFHELCTTFERIAELSWSIMALQERMNV